MSISQLEKLFQVAEYIFC